MPEKRVLILATGLHGASCRFRFIQYLPYLRECGIGVDVADLAVSPARRHHIYAAAVGYDAVLLHRVLLRGPEYHRFRRYVAHYAYDFDDAIMMRDSARRRLASWQRRARFGRMVRGASAVIAGNDYLGDWARRYNPRTTVLPTSVELNDYPLATRADAFSPQHTEHREVVIGWIGTRANLMYLQTIVPALSRVAQRLTAELMPKLKIVADDFLMVPGLEVVRKSWALADEVADVCSFNIGVMPLPDDAWTRGKCALKILQYFAAGVPVICSPVGANLAIVKHGINGYFARTEDEWVACLEELLRDPALRYRMGRAGRQTVEQHYSVAGNAERFMRTLLLDSPVA